MSTDDSVELRTISRMLNNTIKVSPEPAFIPGYCTEIDSCFQKENPVLIFVDDLEHGDIYRRNVFLIGIIGKDSIYIQEDLYSDFIYAKEKLKEFIVNPYNLDDLPRKEYKEIKLLGGKVVSKGAIFFLIPPIPNDSLESISIWMNLRKGVKDVIHVYDEVRDEAAHEVRNVKYNELEKDQQAAINEWIPIPIFIVFNRELKY